MLQVNRSTEKNGNNIKNKIDSIYYVCNLKKNGKLDSINFHRSKKTYYVELRKMPGS